MLLTVAACDGASTTVAGEPCTEDGAERSCYDGAPATLGLGICRAGRQRCVGEVWSVCLGQVLPSAETCNERDDDCNGESDEGCPCEPGSTKECYSAAPATAGVGVCRTGTRLCSDDAWGECEGETVPSDELCDGFDNDCNGLSDEGCACLDGESQSCYLGPAGTQDHGVCHSGTQVCVDGQWPVTCDGQVTPTGEDCNNLDDDCDDAVDEGGACCSDPCPSHDACGTSACGESCGDPSCPDYGSYEQSCMGTRCIWEMGCDTGLPCNTTCYWGTSTCVGTNMGTCSSCIDPDHQRCYCYQDS